MTDLVKSLRRLYEDKVINEAKIQELLRDGKITTEESRYILRKEE